MKFGGFLALASLALLAASEVRGQQENVVLCYFESWATYRCSKQVKVT